MTCMLDEHEDDINQLRLKTEEVLKNSLKNSNKFD